jgi:uncharacterized protein YjfI (DUF2170 family)
MHSNHYIYCLEAVADIDSSNESGILPSLENLALQYGITNVHKTCDSIEGFEESLSMLLYEDRNFKDYGIVYFVVKGNGNQIILDDFYYSLEEIAEFFEGKLTGKILHFCNQMLLELDKESAQYFLDVTGAKAISGYGNKTPVDSFVIDNLFFWLCQEYEEVTELVEELFLRQYTLCQAMGFQLYY